MKTTLSILCCAVAATAFALPPVRPVLPPDGAVECISNNNHQGPSFGFGGIESVNVISTNDGGTRWRFNR